MASPPQRLKLDALTKPAPNDQKTSAQIQAVDATAAHLRDYLDALFSQIKQIVKGDAEGTWKDDPNTPGSLTHLRALIDAGGGGMPAPAGIDGQAIIEVGSVWASRPILASYVIQPFAITGFSPVGGSNREVGQTVVQPGFTASYNRSPTLATLSDNQGNPPKDVSGTPTSFSSDHTFVKTANNASVAFTLNAARGTELSSAGTSLAWRPRAYYGVGPDGGSTEEFIEALAGSFLAASRATSFSFNAGSGQHIYYAYPTAYGAATFYIGGFEGGFVLVGTISVTNVYGVTQDYYLYKSVQPNLGSGTVTVI